MTELITLHKVTELPNTLSSHELYLVKNNTSDSVELFAVDSNNNPLPVYDKLLTIDLSDEVLSKYSIIEGPNTTTPTEPVDLYILNYDSFTDYNITGINGYCEREEDKITYYPDGTLGNGGFIINCQLVSVVVTLPITDDPTGSSYPPDAPTILVPVTGDPEIDRKFTIINTRFTSRNSLATQDSAVWEISTSPNFNIDDRVGFFDLYGAQFECVVDWLSLDKQYLKELVSTKIYFIRSLYRDNNRLESPWSNIVSFTVIPLITGFEETAVVRAYSDVLALSGDGKCIVSKISWGNGGFRLIIHRHVSNSWEREGYIISDSSSIVFDLTHKDVAINFDGTRIFIVTNLSIFLEYTKICLAYELDQNNNTWSKKAEIVVYDSDQSIGYHCAATNRDGTILAIGCPTYINNPSVINGSYSDCSNFGAVFVYDTTVLTNITFIQRIKEESFFISEGENTLQFGVIAGQHFSNSFGYSVSIASDSNTLAIAAPHYVLGTHFLNVDLKKAVYVYSGGLGGYTLSGTCRSTAVPTHWGEFGLGDIKISSDGSLLVIPASITLIKHEIDQFNMPVLIDYPNHQVLQVFAPDGEDWKVIDNIIDEDPSHHLVGQLYATNDDCSVIYSSITTDLGTYKYFNKYVRIGYSWSLHSKNKPYYFAPSDHFSAALFISNDGSTLVCSGNLAQPHYYRNLLILEPDANAPSTEEYFEIEVPFISGAGSDISVVITVKSKVPGSLIPYQLKCEVSADVAFTDPTVIVFPANHLNQYDVPNSEHNGRYYRVSFILDDGQVSPYSNIFAHGLTIPEILLSSNMDINRLLYVEATAIQNIATLSKSEWELSTSSDFTTGVTIITETDVAIYKRLYPDKLSVTKTIITGLLANTVYYLRVRYVYEDIFNGEYSPSVQFTTNEVYLPYTETVKLIPTVSTGTGYGQSVTVSGDGLLIAVGTTESLIIVVTPDMPLTESAVRTERKYGDGRPSELVDVIEKCGKVFIYKFNGISWILEQKITASPPLANTNFSKTLFFNYDGSYLLVTDINDKIFVYKRDPSDSMNWILVQTIITSADYGVPFFSASKKALSTDGNYLAILGNCMHDPYIGQLSLFYNVLLIYAFDGTSWNLVYDVEIPYSGGGSFEISVAIDALGQRVAVGNAYASTTEFHNEGAAYIYRRDGSTWAYETIIVSGDRKNNGYFGKDLKFNASGEQLVIGSSTTGNVITAGGVYVFIFDGETWLQEAKLDAGADITDGTFGSSILVDAAGTCIIVLKYPSVNSVNGASYFVFFKVNGAWVKQPTLYTTDKFLPYHPSTLIGALTPNSRYLVVGGPGAMMGGYQNGGAVYIFDRYYT